MNYDEDEDFCDDCFSIRQSDSDRAIHQYAYEPPWVYHRSSLDRQRQEVDSFFLGVELEVENTSNGIYDNSDTARVVKKLVPAVCKQDGSINNGFEIVFHPQTYTYATNDGRQGIENCLRELRQRHFAGKE